MSNNIQAFTTLVQDCLAFIREQCEEKAQTAPSSLLPIKSEKSPPKTPELAVEPKVQKIELKTEIAAPKPIEEVRWALVSFPQMEKSDALRAKFSNLFPKEALTSPSLSFLFLLPEEKVEHRLFLETVARAVTRTVGPSCVMLAENGCEAIAKVIAAPMSFLKKTSPHTFYSTEKSQVLVLDELDNYLHNSQLKRLLWNTLKNCHFPNTPQSH